MSLDTHAQTGALLGDRVQVPVRGRGLRPYVDLDCAATSSVSVAVQRAVEDFLPWYSSVHRGAGAKSRYASARYEQAREVVLRFVGADPATHQVLFPRNTTEALNILAYRLRLSGDDVVVTTAAEHHANVLPWRRHARLRVVDVGTEGAFGVDDVERALDRSPAPKVLAVTGASNVTGWVPPLRQIAAAARRRGVLVAVDAAQLAPHRPIDMQALGIDVLSLSGHKMFAPYGAGALIAPKRLLSEGEPFLVGGGSVAAVSFEDVVWAASPDRDEAGSPNVIGVIALAAAMEDLLATGWSSILAHERLLTRALDTELSTVPGLRRYGPADADRLPVAAFNLDGVPHGLLAARLSQEHGIGVRSGCFCAHPYMSRLLTLTPGEVAQFHDDVRAGSHHRLPGAVRASANRATTLDDVAALGHALRAVAGTPESSSLYECDSSGHYAPLPPPVPAQRSATDQRLRDDVPLRLPPEASARG